MQSFENSLQQITSSLRISPDMKLVVNLIGLVAAAYFGYMFEPSLRALLTGTQPSAIETGKDKRVVLDMPGDAPLIELATLTLDQLPEKLLIKTAVDVSDTSSGMTMTIKEGSRVKLVRIEGANAVVSPGERSLTGIIPITETDLFQQLATNPPSSERLAVAPPIVIPEKVKETADEELEKTEEKPQALVKSDPVVEKTSVAVEEASSETSRTIDVVELMHASIKAAEIKEFTFDKVLEWQAGGDEVINGETFQTGFASYKAETIFGAKTLKAKALISKGQVQRWVWENTGKQIK
jgi:hypothetical protein